MVWSGNVPHVGYPGPNPIHTVPLPLVSGVPLTAATIVTIIYVVSYICMEPVVGGLGAILVMALNQWTFDLVQDNSPVFGLPLWKAVLAFHVFCWIVQFIGHGVFEGRAPALLDSWDQAFITAPLFVLLEVAFFFGYRRNFYEECMKEVEENLAVFRN